VVVSLLLQNVWRYLHYEVCGDARRGRASPWWWPYKEFVNMIRRAAWDPRGASGRPRESAT